MGEKKVIYCVLIAYINSPAGIQLVLGPYEDNKKRQRTKQMYHFGWSQNTGGLEAIWCEKMCGFVTPPFILHCTHSTLNTKAGLNLFIWWDFANTTFIASNTLVFSSKRPLFSVTLPSVWCPSSSALSVHGSFPVNISRRNIFDNRIVVASWLTTEHNLKTKKIMD